MISVEAVPEKKSFEILSKLSWVKKIKLHNGIINLNVDRGENKIPLLIKIDQKEEGFEIKSVNLRKPTLEDVFLHFTGRTIREKEANQNDRNKIMMMRRSRR